VYLGKRRSSRSRNASPPSFLASYISRSARLPWSLRIALFNRLRFSGILLATREEGIVTPLHIGMIGTINAEQLSATSNKTHDALVRRHAMGKNPGGSAYGYEKRIESPALGIVPLELWDRVKFRQATLARTAKPRTEMAGLPFFAEQRPRYLLTGKITCGSCGASYAKSGKTRFGCQGAAKKGPTWCGNRLTIRQDELDARVLAGLATEMLRDDVVAAFLLEYEAETRRLTAETVSAGPEREAELANLDHKLSRAKAAILKGVDAMVFVDEMKIWTERRKALLAELNLAEQETTDTVSPEPGLLTPDLGRVYREKVEQLTAAFEDEALKAQASERLRALIEAVLTPEDGDLAIDLRGELVSMVSLCAGAETQKASAGIPSEAL
jgi:site-specific DNA recombinase